MTGKEPEVGSTAKTVAANVERLRMGQNMNYTQLSDRLESAANWSINAVGIRRIEAGERRVTADDLMALAVALDVSPITLLMPSTESADDLVQATGVQDGLPARRLWDWLAAAEPPTGDTAETVFGFLFRSIPRWLFGDKVDLVVSGVGPNITRSVRRYGSEQILREHADGDD